MVDVDPYTFTTYGTLFPSELRFEGAPSANESRGAESEFEHVSSAEHVISREQRPTRNVSDRTEAKVEATFELPFESTDVVRYNRTVIKLLPLVALVIIIATYLRRALVHHHGPNSSRCERRQRARARRVLRAGGACEGCSSRAARTKSHARCRSHPVCGSLSSAGGFVSKSTGSSCARHIKRARTQG